MKHKLEIDSVQLKFGDRSILSNIYLKCETGKITGLLGRNGVGKSCLMKIIYGVLRAERSVRIDGLSQPEAFKRPDQLLYLPQFNFIPPSRSLKNSFRDFGIDIIAFLQAFPEYASKVKRHIGDLSGGERRFVEVYLILKANSRFIMLDEPFTHLNPIQIEKVKALLSEEKSNKGVLVSDHMYRHVLDVCDDLYVLTKEKIHLTKTFQDIEKLGYAKYIIR